jgi:hypothetical protein
VAGTPDDPYCKNQQDGELVGRDERMDDASPKSAERFDDIMRLRLGRPAQRERASAVEPAIERSPARTAITAPDRRVESRFLGAPNPQRRIPSFDA